MQIQLLINPIIVLLLINKLLVLLLINTVLILLLIKTHTVLTNTHTVRTTNHLIKHTHSANNQHHRPNTNPSPHQNKTDVSNNLKKYNERKGWLNEMPVIPGIEWTREHLMAWKMVGEGKNMLVHGAGGTGKSVWLVEVAKECKRIGLVTYVTATTGTAAHNLNIQAITLHAWYGSRQSLPWHQVVKHMYDEQKARLLATDALIIDECSMLSGTFF